MIKLKKIEITGLRGVRKKLPLNLDNKSILLFGENAAGKSTLSDVIEWFYKDKVDHLSNEEIGRNGLEALRNIFLKEDEKGLLDIQFSNNAYDSIKSIYPKRQKLETDQSNKNPDFEDYLKISQKENFILRYRDLVNFILASKSVKLKNISDIIGFSELIATRQALLKSRNAVAKEVKIKDFDNQISLKQGQILNYLKQTVISDDQFVTAVNSFIGPLNICPQIKEFSKINEVIESIKKSDNSGIIEQVNFYQGIIDFCETYPSKIEATTNNYPEYFKLFGDFISNADKLKNVILEKLFTEGLAVLRGGILEKDKCPLCLQAKGADALQSELTERLNELKSFRDEKAKVIEMGKTIKQEITQIIGVFDNLLLDGKFKDTQNALLSEYLKKIKEALIKYLTELKSDISPKDTPLPVEKLMINLDNFKNAQEFCSQRINVLKEKDSQKNITDVIVSIEHSKNAYLEIKALKSSKDVLEKQLLTLQAAYDNFIMRQKEALNSFILNFSTEWNDFYKFMNPDEKVEEVKLLLLGNDDELDGVTIQFKFFDNTVAPPQRYLSESHLNCLGISFFLTSVKAFNQKNGFLILDDVISSFDSNHRKRFADLLLEKFSDYQIILLTHEKNWFDYVNNQVKNKNWVVKKMLWNENDGTRIDETANELRQRIEHKFANKNINGLGNDLRKYLEGFLKAIAFNLRVKVDFRYNPENEDRMSYELLTELKGSIKRHADDSLKNNAIFDRLLGSIFVGNKDSHNSSFIPSVGDLTAFWRDIQDLEAIFLCDNPKCKRIISVKYYDEYNKNIRCGCGGKTYSWKKS